MRTRSPSLFPCRIVPLSLLHRLSALHAGPVTGQVVDPDGRAGAPARVVLLTDGASSRALTTNARRAVHARRRRTRGRYELRVALDGFRAEPCDVDGSAAPRDLGRVNLAGSAPSPNRSSFRRRRSRFRCRRPRRRHGDHRRRAAGRQVTTVADALRQVPGLTVAVPAAAGRADERLSARRRIGLLARVRRRRAGQRASAAASTSRICRRPTSSASRSSADRRARSTDRTRSARSSGS